MHDRAGCSSEVVTRKYNLRPRPGDDGPGDDHLYNENIAIEVQGLEEVGVNEEEMGDEQAQSEPYKHLKTRFDWSVVEPIDLNIKLVPECTVHPDFTQGVLCPIDYYCKFMDKEVLEWICQESNRFQLQEDHDNPPLNLEIIELEQFFGVSLYMSLIKLPRTRFYWQGDVEIKAVTETMSMRRWEKIKRFLHIADNQKAAEKGTEGYDRIYKVRPFVDLLNARFNKIPLYTSSYCVDEQMVPYSGTRGPRMYVKRKPNPWGFKVWALANSEGVVYNIDIATGKTPQQEGHPDIGSIGNLVLKLCTILPNNLNLKMFMDNYFSGVPLFLELLKRGIYCLGTVRLNRVPGLNSILITDKELKDQGRSAFVEYQGEHDKSGNKCIRVVRWNDNNIFNLMYTFGSALPKDTVQRWDRTTGVNSKITVPCPATVKLYNAGMGGLDLMDSIVAYYRMFFRSKKWYHRLIFHFVDLCVSNAWLLYKRDFRSSEAPGKPISLYDFKANISCVLRNQRKPLKKVVGRPTALAPKPVTRNIRVKLPPREVIEDQVGHFPVCLQKKGKCAIVKCKGIVTTYCIKCKAHLCVAFRGRQCFLDFHSVPYDMSKLPN